MAGGNPEVFVHETTHRVITRNAATAGDQATQG